METNINIEIVKLPEEKCTEFGNLAITKSAGCSELTDRDWHEVLDWVEAVVTFKKYQKDNTEDTEWTEKVVENCGKFKLRYGYNSSMDIGNVFGTLEQMGIPGKEVGELMVEMVKEGVPKEKMVNYLADHYRLFGY